MKQIRQLKVLNKHQDFQQCFRAQTVLLVLKLCLVDKITGHGKELQHQGQLVSADTVWRVLLRLPVKTKNTHSQAVDRGLKISPKTMTRELFAGPSSGEVVWGWREVPGTQGVGLRPSAGQSGVGRGRKPHGANDGTDVLLLLVMLG